MQPFQKIKTVEVKQLDGSARRKNSFRRKKLSPEFGCQRLAALSQCFLPLQFAAATDSLGSLSYTFFGWFFVSPFCFQCSKNAFSLHSLFENAQSLVNIIIANEDLHTFPNISGF